MDIVDDDIDNGSSLSIKTDSTGNRIVIRANNNDLSKNQNKLMSIKKPIIKRTVNSSSKSSILTSNEDKQGQVALKLLGDFIKKPQNDTKSKNENNDRPILSRLKF